MRLVVFNQAEDKIGLSSLLGYHLLKLSQNGTKVALMSEDLKIASALSMKGVNTIRNIKGLNYYLKNTTDKQSLLVIDTIEMFRSKELKSVIASICENENPAFDDTYVIFVCRGTKQRCKKGSTLFTGLVNHKYEIYTIAKDRDAVCIYNESNVCIKDVTDSIQSSYVKIIR